MTTEFNCFDIFHLGDFLVLAQRLLVHAFVVVVARFLNKFDKISSIPGLAINVYSFVGTIFFCWGIVPFFIFHSQLFERKPAVVRQLSSLQCTVAEKIRVEREKKIVRDRHTKRNDFVAPALRILLGV